MAVGLVQVLHDRLVPGDHVYVAAPDTESGALPPIQIAAGVPAVSTGTGNMVTLTVSTSVQPFAALPVTVYRVLAGGPATGLGHDVQDKPVPGDHE